MGANNMAAMREAFVNILKDVSGALEALNEIPENYGYNGLVEDAADALCAIRDYAEKALKKPPRNCDFYDNKTDAETGFVEETGEDDREQHYWQMFANWLFSPAAERKGDNDEK